MSDKKVHSLERVVEAAAHAFSTRKFDDVSVGTISETAHCSTSTIYMTFGSKENLFLVAMKHLLDKTSLGPNFERRTSLHTLIGFAEARIRSLADPTRRGVVRAISSNPELARPLMQDLAGNECGHIARLLHNEIVACISDGLIRNFEPELVAYTIVAVTGYEPMVYGLMYGNDRKVNVSKLLERVFLPLLTAEGERRFGCYQSANELVPASIRAASISTIWPDGGRARAAVRMASRTSG